MGCKTVWPLGGFFLNLQPFGPVGRTCWQNDEPVAQLNRAPAF